MSGVWTFNKGIVRLDENGGAAAGEEVRRRKALMCVPGDEVVNSYGDLQRRLEELGWKRFHDDPDHLQFHRPGSVDIISLPHDFARFNSVHMYDIVVKNRDHFRVVDV